VDRCAGEAEHCEEEGHRGLTTPAWSHHSHSCQVHFLQAALLGFHGPRAAQLQRLGEQTDICPSEHYLLKCIPV
jgi:hypothetical protein